MSNIKKLLSISGILALSLMMVAVALADTTIEVTGDTSAGENQPGWMFNRDASTSTPFEFNSDAASIGAGSLYVLPIGSNASDKFIAENFINTAIADVDSISYDFMIGSGGDGTDAGQFYMNVYTDFGVSADTKFYDCRYDVVPGAGSTSEFTTVTFDPTQAYPVTQSGTFPFTCPAIPADMDSLSTGSTIRAFALNVGDTSTSDVGLDGYLDNVVVSVNGEVTTYDFEPLITPGDKNKGIVTAPGQNKLICFDGTTDGGYNGVCTLTSNGAKGPATLNNIDGDEDPYNNYSGVYTATSNMYGKLLADVGQLKFSYSGDAATAGSPRLSIPVSIDGDATTDGYLFISALYCNDGAGLVDAINDPTCTIYTNFSAESFDNWADLIATHPDWSVATDAYVFLIADDPGMWTVNNVTFGKPGK